MEKQPSIPEVMVDSQKPGEQWEKFPKAQLKKRVQQHKQQSKSTQADEKKAEQKVEMLYEIKFQKV